MGAGGLQQQVGSGGTAGGAMRVVVQIGARRVRVYGHRRCLGGRS